MPKVLVLFHSRTGHTAALAAAIAEGASAVRFSEVEVRRIDDLAPSSVSDASPEWKSARAALAKKYRLLESIESLADYDAVVVGSPARYGIMSAELKNVLDQAGPLWQRGALAEKVGSAFGSAAAMRAGQELSVMSMLISLMHLGMIIVPPAQGSAPQAEPEHPVHSEADAGGGGPGAAELAAARQQGMRVAKVAEWVRHAKSHDSHGHRH